MDFATAAIFWDPHPQAFTIPYFDRPIMWYGVCWVVGFFFAYVLIIPMLAEKLAHVRYIRNRDIADWNALFQTLQSSQSAQIQKIRQFLPANTWKEIDRTPAANLAKNEQMQATVLQACNSYLSSQPALNRADLQKLFPQGLFPARTLGSYLGDLLLWYTIFGAILGARLGHVLFYDLPRFIHHPLDILKIWEGGLASHGGAIGVIIALVLYARAIRKNYPEINFMTILDLIVVPTAFVAFCIRIGNFINQEILGMPTTMPWGVIFGHPADGTAPLPRHPVQLYEAAVNLVLFLALYMLWKTKGDKLRTGYLSGLFFMVVFGSRIILEFFKAPLSLVIDESTFTMGQWLSVPFVLIGLLLFLGKIPPCMQNHRRDLASND